MNTGPPSAGAERVLGVWLRGFEHLHAPFQLLTTNCLTVLLEVVVHSFGRPTFLRFARFRAICISLSVIELLARRETAQSAKGWPSFPFQPPAVAQGASTFPGHRWLTVPCPASSTCGRASLRSGLWRDVEGTRASGRLSHILHERERGRR